MNKYDTEYERIVDILKYLPIIRKLLETRKPYETEWNSIKDICIPLGLTDTSFREQCNLNDFLISFEYWTEQLRKEFERKNK